MDMFAKYDYLISQELKITAFCLCIQQLIVASSTYFIARLAAGVGQGEIVMLYAVLFVISLVAVYMPAYFCMVYIERATYTAWLGYIKRFKEKFLGRVGFYTDDKTRQTSLAMLSQESKASIDSTLNTAFEIASLLLNIVLNILVFALVLDSSILLGYVAGMLIACVYLHKFSRLDDIAKAAQDSRLAVIAWLNKAWDNVVLDNKYSQHIYQTQLQNKFNEAKWANVHCQSASHIVSNVGMLCLIVPVMAITAVLFYKNMNDLAVVAVLVVTLPRQVQLLQVCYTLISYGVNISIVRSRLDGLEQALAVNEPNLAQRVRKGEILVKQSQQVFDPHTLPKTGRITLIGKNGVGKSSQLLLLKQTLGSRAFYLPAKHELCFDDDVQGSTGQKLIGQLGQIAQLDESVLLLDEWDANLDRTNTERLDALIDQLAEHKLVLEVRHFK